ncbi:MAG: hypothetical protein QW478_15855, partial [Candidatus Micrarchaeaceae archaeon]
ELFLSSEAIFSKSPFQYVTSTIHLYTQLHSRRRVNSHIPGYTENPFSKSGCTAARLIERFKKAGQAAERFKYQVSSIYK